MLAVERGESSQKCTTAGMEWVEGWNVVNAYEKYNSMVIIIIINKAWNKIDTNI